MGHLKGLCVLIFTIVVCTGCTHLFYVPDRVYHFPPEQLGYYPQEVFFSSKDDTKLYAWFFRSKVKEIKGTVIQFHGNGENISSHYLSTVWMIEHGYNVFTFDYRGYGRSEGKARPDGVYLDGLAALEEAWAWHSESGVDESQFIVLGQSLGGAIAMKTLGDSSVKANTDLLILDSTFSSYKRIARMKLSSHWLTWLLSPLTYILITDKYAIEEELKKNEVPLLVLHDKEDPIVPFECGKRVAELGKKKLIEFWQLNGTRHLGALANPRSSYRQKLLDLLAKIKK